MFVWVFPARLWPCEGEACNTPLAPQNEWQVFGNLYEFYRLALGGSNYKGTHPTD